MAASKRFSASVEPVTIDTREITLNRSIGELLARQSAMNEHLERVEERFDALEARTQSIEKVLNNMQHIQRVWRWVLTIFTGVVGSVLTAFLIKLFIN